jgi:glucosamine 6-phosphate synthetase-like amidotransferase/phosphosugar isomerase protein
LKLKEIIEELEEIPNKLESILKDTKNIKSLSEKYSKYKDMFFL